MRHQTHHLPAIAWLCAAANHPPIANSPFLERSYFEKLPPPFCSVFTCTVQYIYIYKYNYIYIYITLYYFEIKFFHVFQMLVPTENWISIGFSFSMNQSVVVVRQERAAGTQPRNSHKIAAQVARSPMVPPLLRASCNCELQQFAGGWHVETIQSFLLFR